MIALQFVRTCMVDLLEFDLRRPSSLITRTQPAGVRFTPQLSSTPAPQALRAVCKIEARSTRDPLGPFLGRVGR